MGKKISISTAIPSYIIINLRSIVYINDANIVSIKIGLVWFDFVMFCLFVCVFFCCVRMHFPFNLTSYKKMQLPFACTECNSNGLFDMILISLFLFLLLIKSSPLLSLSSSSLHKWLSDLSNVEKPFFELHKMHLNQCNFPAIVLVFRQVNAT